MFESLKNLLKHFIGSQESTGNQESISKSSESIADDNNSEIVASSVVSHEIQQVVSEAAVGENQSIEPGDQESETLPSSSANNEPESMVLESDLESQVADKSNMQ